MAKEISAFGESKFKKKTNCPTLVPLINADIQKLLVSNKISLCEKNYKYFIGYLYSDNKVKPLHIMLPKRSPYVKSYDGQTKWMYYFIEEDDLLKNITLFGIESALI